MKTKKQDAKGKDMHITQAKPKPINDLKQLITAAHRRALETFKNITCK